MGASSGIGYALAEAFASRGVKIGVSARHTESLHNLQKQFPGFIEYASIDITHKDAPEKLEELAGRLGGMDIYIHVSGIGYRNPELDPELEVDIFKTNVCGFARMISAVYGYFRRNNIRGQIAAITSVAGTKGIGQMPAYSASKAMDSAYLTALSQLATTQNSGISITDIRPGWVTTPLLNPDFRYPMQMEPDYVVPLILKAIASKRRVAVIDWRWNILVGLWRIIPNSLWRRLSITLSNPADDRAL